MKIFYLLGFIILGFSALIILLPEYHSVTEISDNNTSLNFYQNFDALEKVGT